MSSTIQQPRLPHDAHVDAADLRVLLVAEMVLGHRQLADRLAAGLSAVDGVDVDYRPVENPNRRLSRAFCSRRIGPLGELDLLPVRWTLRYGLRGHRHVAAGAEGADVALVNTQSCAVLLGRWHRRLPIAVMADAGPSQYLRQDYHGRRSRRSAPAEAMIRGLERSALQRAAAVFTLSRWAARGMTAEDGVDPACVEVLHPGIDIAAVRITGRTEREPGAPLRVLFLGNDVDRKGLAALRAGIARCAAPIRLDVVTTDDIAPGDDMVVHHGITADSDAMRERLREADVLALLSRADVSPNALIEGMAAGLAVLTTEAGAIPELVGDDGIYVDANDPMAVAAALDGLHADPADCVERGRRLAARARAHYDARVQVRRLADRLAALAAVDARRAG